MYYIAKFFQAAGLTIILVGFLLRFPALMNPRLFLLGLILFGTGWVINHFMLKTK